MKKEHVQDERVLAQKRKIGSDAYQILFYGLFLSIFIQQDLFDAPFSQYAVEVILLLCTAAYVVIRHLAAGNDLFASKGSQKLVIMNSLVCGVIVSVVNTTLNYMKLGDQFRTDMVNTLLISGITFLSASVIVFVVLELFYIVNEKKQKKIEVQLNQEEK